jgi:CRP/FNR family transcriptional regulator, cyclic AMP receptor protein
MTPVDKLRGVPAFAGLSDKELRDLAAALTRVTVRAGQAIIREGESQVDKQGLFVLIEGHVQVFKKGRDLATLGPGTVFGEVELLTRVAPTATVQAKDDLVLLWLGRDRFDERVRAGDLAVYRLVYNVARVLAARLRATDERAVALVPEARQQELGEIRGRIFADWDV